ncbi:MAG: hypothetical protein JNK65_01375, partial [Deltaproteobacteria bacterium]|nr:hypothetical protein [Deltaproteobacteria bacterium]
ILKGFINNTGNTHYQGVGSLVLMDANNQLITKVDANVPLIFPGQKKSFSVSLVEPVKPGTYKAILSVSEPNKGSALVKDFPVTIPAK